MKVAFDAVVFTQTAAGSARVARGLLDAVRGRHPGIEVIEIGGGDLRARGSAAQRALAVRQDLLWYAGGGVRRAAQRAGADLVHLPTFRGPLRAGPPPAVVTVHDLEVLRHPEWFPRWSGTYGRLAVPRALRAATRVVCVSHASARAVVALGVPERRVRVVHNGIDAFWGEPAGPPPVTGPYLLAVGTREPRKNLARVLEAHRLLRWQARPERLVVVGDAGWGDVAPPAGEGVVALGRVPDRTLRDLYAHAAAVVFPSLAEGFGLVVGEALAAGARIVASDLEAHREVAGDDAVYCDPLDPASIASAVIAALAGPAPAARRDLTWEAAADALVAVWREVCP